MVIKTFQTLPDELVIEILRLAETRTLGALSACSKRFNFLIEPVLYSTFKQTSIRTRTLPRFIRTVLRNPSLALHVKTFIGTSEPNICSDMEFLGEYSINMFKEALTLAYNHNIGKDCWEYDHNIKRRFWHCVEQGNWDALIALLLCLLPNLQEIRMVRYGDFYDGYPFIETILDRAAKLQDAGQLSPFLFAKLRRVSLENQDYENFPYRGMGLYQLLPYLALKSVDSVSSHMVTDLEFSHVQVPNEIQTIYKFPLPAFDFSKTSLVLDHSFISSTALPAFLGLFKSLKSLRYDFKYTIDVSDENEWNTDIVPGDILAAISHLSDSLEELVLTQQEFREVDRNDSADQTIPSFSEFQKLKRIEASPHILLGRHRGGPVPKYRPNQIQRFTRLFPTSLESLVIKNCNVALFDVMSEWLLHELPPNLAMVKLEIQNGTVMEPGDLEGPSLEDLFLRRGVMFTCCAPSSTEYCQACTEYLTREQAD